jgi:hypothetical protein
MNLIFFNSLLLVKLGGGLFGGTGYLKKYGNTVNKQNYMHTYTTYLVYVMPLQPQQLPN